MSDTTHARGFNRPAEVIPTRDLPRDLRDDRIAISCPFTAAVVLVVLTRYVGYLTGRTRLNRLGLSLTLYAHTPIDMEGASSPAPNPEVPRDLSSPELRTVLSPAPGRHGLRESTLRRLYRKARARSPIMPKMPVWVVCRFVHPCLWRVLASLIADGPRLATVRVNTALASAATSTSAWTGRPLGQSALEVRATTLRWLIENVREVFLSHPVPEMVPEHLRTWLTEEAGRIEVPAEAGNLTDKTNRTATPLWLVRRALRDLDRDVKRLLGLPVDARQEAVVARLEHASPSRLSRSGLYRRLQVRAALAMMATLGTRVQATCDIRRGDLLAGGEHFGVQGPSIAVRPGKHWHSEQRMIKVVPTDLFLMVWALVAYSERRVGRPLRPDEFVFTARRDAPEVALAQQSLRESMKKLFPRTPGLSDNTPHALRYRAAQSLELRSEAEWRRRGMYKTVKQLSGVLLDHRKNMPEEGRPLEVDKVGDKYHGVSGEADRVRLTAVAVESNWSFVWGDEGRPLMIDRRALCAAALRLQGLEDEREVLARDARDIAHDGEVELCQLNDLYERAVERRDGPGDADAFGRVHSSLRSHLRRVARLDTGLLDREIADAEREVKAIAHDRERMIDWTEEGPPPLEDPEKAIADARRLARALESDVALRRTRRRNWLSPKELSYVAGYEESAVRYWLRQPRAVVVGGIPVWRFGEPPVWAGSTERLRHLIVDGINLEAVGRAGWRERLEEVLSRPAPRGWPPRHSPGDIDWPGGAPV